MKLLNKFLAASALALLATVSVASAQVPGIPGPNFKNLLDNPRFDVYQRGTTAVTGVVQAPTYHADRWAGSASNASASETLTNVTSSLPIGFANAEKFQRAAANAQVTPVCLMQEIPTSDIIPLQGQPVALSSWILAGGNLSSAGSVVSLGITTGTGTDQGLLLLTNGGWTGQAAATFSQGITTTWARYSWTTTLPATATEAAVTLCFTPVGTAGTDDSVTVTGVQLEQGTFSSNFEVRPLGVETAKVQRYFYQLNEGTASSVVALCQVPSTTNETCLIPLPVPLRLAAVPSTAITITTGTFKLNAAGAFSTWTSPTASNSNATGLTVTAASAGTAGQIQTLYGGSGGSGKVSVTADF